MDKKKDSVQPKAKTWQIILLIILAMILVINLLNYIPQPQSGDIPSIQSNSIAALKTAVPIAGIAAIIIVLFKSKKK